jgi:hypothetical protein
LFPLHEVLPVCAVVFVDHVRDSASTVLGGDQRGISANIPMATVYYDADLEWKVAGEERFCPKLVEHALISA